MHHPLAKFLGKFGKNLGQFGQNLGKFRLNLDKVSKMFVNLVKFG